MFRVFKGNLYRRFVGTYDAWCGRVGRKKWYKSFYWKMTTFENHFAIGMGKFYQFKQFLSFFAYAGMGLLFLEKFFAIPLWIAKYFVLGSLPIFIIFLLLGRFIDKSGSIHIGAEWGNKRNPGIIEIRKNVKKVKK